MICIVLSILKIWLISAQTITPLSRYWYDDELFLSLAESLLQGDWLGKADHLVMGKGPIYSLWLYLNHLSGIPLLLSQSMLYIIACWVLVQALCPIVKSSWGRSLLYSAVLFNPASWANEPATRIIREGIYPSLTLFLLACAIGVMLRLNSGPKSVVPWAVAAGLSGALFAMTREEGIWLLPSLALILLVGVVVSRRARFWAWVVAASCVTISYGLPILVVATANEQHYGVFATCETTSEYFRSAYGALTRVKSSSWNPYVPVSRESLQKIYSQSPAFREVAPLDTKWVKYGCDALGICDEISGGWFTWALRDAVNAAGKYRQGVSGARDWYRQLAREIDSACSSGRLDCLPRRSSLLPPLHRQYLRPFFSSFLRAVYFLPTFKDILEQTRPPDATESDILRFEAMTREHVPRNRVQMTGLLASRIGEVNAKVLTVHGKVIDDVVKLEPMNFDAGPEGRGFVFWRCSVETSYMIPAQLEFQGRDRLKLIVPLNKDAQEGGIENLKWKTERFQIVPVAREAHKTLANFRIRALEVLTKLYALLMPLLGAVSVSLLFMRLLRDLRARSLHAIHIFSLALLVAVVVRLLLLSLIDISSCPAINVLYCAPAYPLYIAMVMLVLVYEGERAVRHKIGDASLNP